MGKFNSKAFTPEEVEQGLFQDLLNYLLDYNKKCKSGFYDIHITSDGYCSIVEWENSWYDYPEVTGSFKFVNSDEYIMKEIMYPDNTYEMIYPEEEEEKLEEWHKQHPEWIKTSYGIWTNEEENEKWRKMLGEGNNE